MADPPPKAQINRYRIHLCATFLWLDLQIMVVNQVL